MNRGEIFWAKLHPRSGSEQQGHRPVIVISRNTFNQSSWRTIIVVPVSSSQAQAKRGLTGIFLPAGSGGLNKDSVALCHQITTLDRSKIGQFIGTLDPQLLNQVEDGLKHAMQLP